MQKPICPICDQQLSAEAQSHGNIWECPSCQGCMVNLTVLRNSVGDKTVNTFWREANQTGSQSIKRCPSCRSYLTEFKAFPQNNKLNLDICTKCQLLWFDPGELNRIPSNKKEMSEEFRSQIAMAEITNRKEIRDFEEKIETVVNIAGGVLALAR